MTTEVAPAPSLRVATWNIHDARGMAGRRNLERVVELIGELRAPIVGLQEIRCGALACDAAFLAQRHGYAWRAIGTRRQADLEHGNALLTTLPILGSREHDLSVMRREPRAALEVEIAWQERRLRVVVTHLGLRSGERRTQVERLLARLPSDDITTILLGDINEWSLWGRPLRWLHRRFGASPSMRTYPAPLPLFALDRVWVSSPWSVSSVRTLSGPGPRSASDHLPLIATLRPRDTGEGR